MKLLAPVLLGAALATSLGAGPLAFAADEGAHPHARHVKFLHRFGPSVEHAAMRNIVAEALSAKTGRSAAEISAKLDDTSPQDVAREFDLSEADMKALHKQARLTLIQRAAAAGLITAAQADELRKAPMPEHPPRPPMPPEIEDDEG